MNLGCQLGNVGLIMATLGHSRVMNSKLLIASSTSGIVFRDRLDSCTVNLVTQGPMLEHEKYDKVPEQLILCQPLS